MLNSSSLKPNARRPRAGLPTFAVAALVAGCLFASTAQAQLYTNVTVGGQFAPGVFGQISIGSAPPPPVINAAPVIVGTPVVGAPIMYMHVSDREIHDWRHACRRYNACGHPVHFVKVDQNNRWWEHGGPEVRHEEVRHDEMRHEEMRHEEGRRDGNGRLLPDEERR